MWSPMPQTSTGTWTTWVIMPLLLLPLIQSKVNYFHYYGICVFVLIFNNSWKWSLPQVWHGWWIEVCLLLLTPLFHFSFIFYFVILIIIVIQRYSRRFLAGISFCENLLQPPVFPRTQFSQSVFLLSLLIINKYQFSIINNYYRIPSVL